MDILKGPDLRDKFPVGSPNLKITPDLSNRSHGPHFDVIISIPGGTEQVRVTPGGDVIGGTTNIGHEKVGW